MKTVASCFKKAFELSQVDSNLEFNAYFNEFGTKILNMLPVEYVCFSSHLSEKNQILKCDNMISKDGHSIELAYDLSSSPCIETIKHKKTFFISSKNFSNQSIVESNLFDKLDTSFYIGTPIFNHEHEIVGVLFAMGNEDFSINEDLIYAWDFVSTLLQNKYHNELFTNNMLKTNDYLARILAEKTHQLATINSQTMEVQKLASLGRVVSGISYEIQNPLEYILENVTCANKFAENLFEILDQYIEDLDTQTKEDIKLDFQEVYLNIKEIGEHAQRLNGMITLIQNQSNTEAQFKEFDLRELISENLKFAYHASKLKRQSIKITSVIDIPTELKKAHLTCDAPSLFLNLFENILDSMFEEISDNPSKPLYIEISVTSNNNTLEVLVEDNGKMLESYDFSLIENILEKNSGHLRVKSKSNNKNVLEMYFGYPEAS